MEITRATYYAWLGGTQLPGRDALDLLIKAWGGDRAYWLKRRRQAEQGAGGGASAIALDTAVPLGEQESAVSEAREHEEAAETVPPTEAFSTAGYSAALQGSEKYARAMANFLDRLHDLHLCAGLPTEEQIAKSITRMDIDPEVVRHIMDGSVYLGDPEILTEARNAVVGTMPSFLERHRPGEKDRERVAEGVEACLFWADLLKQACVEAALASRAETQLKTRALEARNASRMGSGWELRPKSCPRCLNEPGMGSGCALCISPLVSLKNR
ncbi:hypothetical protein ACFWBI_07920 [Streptomyces sp. NPDC059982]|uniref:hypothetical protein n=1 Tax=unclassified Streptomyces TaxID=2593676 RepID=UPI0036D1F852